MASFEADEVVDPWKVYRPQESAKANARAWWRYAIFAELYRVRCFQRAERWRVVGNKNMNLLSHIRVLIASHGSLEGVDLANISDSYLNDTAEELKYLQTVVGDLSRENMTLRKMIKSLLTPMNKERLISDATTMQYIENQVALLNTHNQTLKSNSTASNSPEKSPSVSPILKLGGSMETEGEDNGDAKDDELDALVNNIESPDLNLRSPYENVLPPIEIIERDSQAVSQGPKGSKKGKSPRSKPVKFVQEKFPSYVEKEAMRKNAAAKKKEQIILRKAERLLQVAAEKEQQSKQKTPMAPASRKSEESSVTMFLPVLPANASPSDKNANQNKVHSDRREPTAELNQGSASLDGASTINKSEKSKKKPIVQPAWVDDFKIEDKLYGRGKGKPKEDDFPPTTKAPQRSIHSVKAVSSSSSSKNYTKSSKKELGICVDSPTKPRADASSPTGVIVAPPSEPKVPINEKDRTSPRGRLVYPKANAAMSDGEKLAVELISKARGKVLSADDVNKPLSKIEMTLLKSPLALPLVKPMPGDASLSPRAAALRASPTGKSTGFRSPRSPGKSAKFSLATGSEGNSPLTLTDESGSSSSALVSQSAPSSVLGAKPPSQQVPLTPIGASNSPVRDSNSEKSFKKKSVLKALNGKTTPISSPRLDENSPGSSVRSTEKCSQPHKEQERLGVYRNLAESLAAASVDSALNQLKLK